MTFDYFCSFYRHEAKRNDVLCNPCQPAVVSILGRVISPFHHHPQPIPTSSNTSQMSQLSPLKATVNCDMGEGFSLYTMCDDDALMQHIHLANIACGFHASDFSIMNKTVGLAKKYDVLVGAHPSLPDRQGFGRREMAMQPDELKSCFIYQIGALLGFLKLHGMKLNHVKPHGAVYGQTARSAALSKAVVEATQTFADESGNHHSIAFVGLAGTEHQTAAEAAGVRFIPEWFADMQYTPEGKLIITQKHEPVSLDGVKDRVMKMLTERRVTTQDGNLLPLGQDNIQEVTICCHSDTPNAVEVTKLVKSLVDAHNKSAGYGP